MLAHALSVAGYVAATLLVQGTSHFVVNKAHYASLPFNRAQPVVALGIAAMLIQGAVLTAAYSASSLHDGSLLGALLVAWAFGAFLASYMALALSGEYSVPSVSRWIVVEATVAAAQFTLIGVLLWLAHRFA